MKKSLKKLRKGKLRPVFRGLYRSLSNSQLGFERLADMTHGDFEVLLPGNIEKNRFRMRRQVRASMIKVSKY